MTYLVHLALAESYRIYHQEDQDQDRVEYSKGKPSLPPSQSKRRSLCVCQESQPSAIVVSIEVRVRGRQGPTLAS
jgi:hypothetical protein